jgi:adenosylmethionine-8-amino-7-oxononanoate aminotransferase
MNNAELLRRSLGAVWHPCTQMKQHAAKRPRLPAATGADRARQGRLALRLRRPPLPRRHQLLVGQPLRPLQPAHQRRLREQLEQLEHVILAGFTHQPVVELSERLSALTGGALGHCFYASDGASATEIALKMSFHSWRNRGRRDKQEFLCLAGSYHGETVGALAVTDVALFKDAYAPLIRPAAPCRRPTHAWRKRRKRRSMSPAAPPRRSKAISNEHHRASPR